MYENIRKYLSGKEAKLKKLTLKPLIIQWLSSASTAEFMAIIDAKVGYLLNNGGESKLKQWFLSNDIDFCTITAERYIIDYLKAKNLGLEDNLGKQGIDATLKYKDQVVGVEITTLNSFVAEWIFIERLTECILKDNLLNDKTIRIKYSASRILSEFRNNSLFTYISALFDNIKKNMFGEMLDLNVDIEIERRWTGSISWEIQKEDILPWLKLLTEDLLCKLITSKQRQLNKHPKNLIFVGVNNIAPVNWVIPSIFEEIGKGGISYVPQIEHIHNFWQNELHNHSNILGVCYFNYSLNMEYPFYPLKIFWRSEAERVEINL